MVRPTEPKPRLGWAVIPAMCTRRVPCSISTRMSSRRRKTVSTRAKSIARIPCVSAQHGNLVTAHQDLDVLGYIGSSEQRQPAQHPGEQQIGESKGHRGIMLRGLQTLTARSADGEGAGQSR